MKKILFGFAMLLALAALPASAASSLAVNSTAAMNSTNFGLQVNVDNSGAGNSAYVESDHPVDEDHILFRFWIRPMPGFSLSQTPNSNFIRIAYGVKDSGTQGVRLVVFLKKSVANGNYRINVWTRNDANVFQNAGEFFLTSGVTPTAQQIEFEYTQGTGSNNGQLIARKGGVVQFTTNNIDNDASPIGKVRLGFIYSPTDTTAVASGPIAYDEYESYR
jgi:hypothetical protein